MANADITAAIVRFIASGNAFFVGAVGIMLAAVLTLARGKASRRRYVGGWSLFFGTLVVLAAVPLTWWANIGLITVTLLWLWSGRNAKPQKDLSTQAPPMGDVDDPRQKTRRQRQVIASCACLLAWLGAVTYEANWARLPTLLRAPANRLIIFADSITAGIGVPGETTWPLLLQERWPNVEVVDRSKMGETFSSALRNFGKKDPGPGLVLLELGGNDLLGDTTPEQFRHDVQALIDRLKRPDRRLVMFELPLPPLGNRYGMIQRRISQEENIALIPRRILTKVLLSQRTTLDSIHLNRAGHVLMAQTVERLLNGSFEFPEREPATRSVSEAPRGR